MTQGGSILSVLIVGDGVAAGTCTHLLRKAGFKVRREIPDRPRVPVIMLSDQAVALLRDVFDDSTLLAGLSRIDRRVVAWGMGATPNPLPHSAGVTSETTLLRALPVQADEDSDGPEDFTIYTSRPLPTGVTEYKFGTRAASAAQVDLISQSDRSACWIESLEQGWLFLIPNAAESAWLLAVGSSLETR